MAVFVFLFSCLSIFASQLPYTLHEEFLSPDVEHFDCHSSSIIETIPGQFCVVWKGGPGEGKCNIDMKEKVGIWISLFDGMYWSEPREIVVVPQSVCWNPVLCKLPNEEILLFYRIGPDPRRVVSFLKRSHDGGANWSEEEMLPAGIIGPSKNRPIVTEEGTLICPSSVQVGEPLDALKATACWVEISPDAGRSWKKIGPLELPNRKFGVIEPALFYDSQGRLHMVCRDRANKIGEKGFIWSAVSEDLGLNWSSLKQTDLPNPDAAIDTVDLGKGKIFLLYNHSHTERYPLNMAISLDGGDHWSDPYLLSETGEFPSGILASDGLIHATYAIPSLNSDQRRIRYVVLDPIPLMENP
jgi:predicted neuraminidase